MLLVLASGSPRRRELLAMIGLDFEVVVPDVDESRHPDEPPAEYVERVARDKALAAARPEAVVLGADTTVVAEGHVLGKPAHPAEARSMLLKLSGAVHAVYTGVAVVAAGETHSAVDVATVRFSPLTEEEIAAYVATGEPMDKAGAYALQGMGAVFVEAVEGSPSTVVGLPLHLTARLLRAAGVPLLGG